MKSISVQKAVEALQRGELVVIPTETVYGLAGNALDQNSVQKIYSVKSRPRHNPVIVHLAGVESVFQFAHKSKAATILSDFWPGPLTIISNHNGKISRQVTANSRLCAFRVPDHPQALKILDLAGVPLAAPSANMSAKTSPTCIDMIDSRILDQTAGVVDGGPCKIGIESTVVEIISETEVVIHRPGFISKKQIEKKGISVLEKYTPAKNPGNHIQLRSPGQMKRHYAPDIPLILLKRISSDKISLNQLVEKFNYKNLAIISFAKNIPKLSKHNKPAAEFQLSGSGNYDEAAKNLFLSFETLSKSNCDAILCIEFPEHELSSALNDRLFRAATHIVSH